MFGRKKQHQCPDGQIMWHGGVSDWVRYVCCRRCHGKGTYREADGFSDGGRECGCPMCAGKGYYYVYVYGGGKIIAI